MKTKSSKHTFAMQHKTHTLKHIAPYSLAVLGFALFAAHSHAAPVINYGEDLTPLKQKMAAGQLHILQIGDSHTAGDYFTEALRKQLQAVLGDGGIGYAPPMKVKGQRVARHGYQSRGWHLQNSRFDTANFPLGGFLATAKRANNALTLTSQYYRGATMPARILVKHPQAGSLQITDAQGSRHFAITGQWQIINTPLTFPASMTATMGTQIAGFWLGGQQGGVVSSMGTNGATQGYWQRWQQGAYAKLAQDLRSSKADLVVLAYGTNEAFSNDISAQKMHTERAIASIRSGLPHAVVLVIGAPESLKSKYGRCGSRPKLLTQVQKNLQQTAMQQRTLYWSWQDAMGGTCSMKSWVKRGLAAHDAVHFSRAGYEKAANDLFDNLYALVNGSAPNQHIPTTPQLPQQPHAPYIEHDNGSFAEHKNQNKNQEKPPNSKGGTGYICFEGKCRRL